MNVYYFIPEVILLNLAESSFTYTWQIPPCQFDYTSSLIYY